MNLKNLVNPAGAPHQPSTTRHLKAQARRLLAPQPDTVVVVQELTCHQPGCPPVETVVAVLTTHGTRRWTVPRPLAQITPTDLEQVLARSPDHDGPVPGPSPCPSDGEIHGADDH